MRGREKGQRERTILLAHQIEAMARQKVLRAPDHYLRNKKPKAKGGPSDVLAMLRRMKKKQDKAPTAE